MNKGKKAAAKGKVTMKDIKPKKSPKGGTTKRLGLNPQPLPP